MKRITATLALALLPVCAAAQELTPGAYWPVPAGINIMTFVNAYNWGDVTFDPALPVDDAHARIDAAIVAYTRAIAVAGRTANLGIQLPIVGGHVEGLYAGVPTTVDRFGLGDPAVRFGINLYGAPSMPPKTFAAYRMHTLVGASLTVVPPLGQYDNTKLINLGSHRWSVKPDVGVSRAIGAWVVEGMAGVWLFSDNRDFNQGHVRTQDAIVSVQGHLTYRFSQRIWLAGDANFYRGGQTAVDGARHQDLQKNSRIGSTFSWGINARSAIRASISEGAYSTVGADFTSIAVGYNYAWVR